MMLFCVVIVFFFCNILALVVNILEVGNKIINPLVPIILEAGYNIMALILVNRV